MEDGLQAMNHRQNLAVWADRITACRGSGLSVRDWCRENGLAEGSYYRWQRKLYGELTKKQTFVEVSLSPAAGPTVAATVSTGDLRMEINTGADEETIRMLLRALKSC